MKPWVKKNILGWGAVLVLFLVWRSFGPGLPVEVLRSHSDIYTAFVNEQTGMMVEFDARVQRLLPDERAGGQAQRFVVVLDNGHSLVVHHNLEESERVPLTPYDTVRVRGEYDWNPHGGVVYWTHRDPGLGLKHGYIEHKGTRYD